MIKAVIFDFFGVLFLEGREPNRPLLDFIKSELKPKYKISILSNADRDYAKERLDKSDYELFNDVLPSFAYGMPKPEAGIYELAAERLGLKTSECLFTDDTQGHCAGALASGMKTVHYENFDTFKEELEKVLAAGPDN